MFMAVYGVQPILGPQAILVSARKLSPVNSGSKTEHLWWHEIDLRSWTDRAVHFSK